MQKNEIERFVLGTAQLGLNYGVTNRTGLPTEEQALDILEYTWEAGIRHYDTAPSYHSESIIGAFVSRNNLGGKIKVLTKIPSMAGRGDWKKFAIRSVKKSFDNLQVDSIKVLFLHAEEDYKFIVDDYKFFKNLMVDYPIESLGISVYEPETVKNAKAVFNNLAYQFPLNILDRRFEEVTMPKGKRYARSIFLQGLLASDQIHPNAANQVKSFHNIIWNDCESLGLSPKVVAWTFITNSSDLDYFLVGAETLNQLKNVLQLEALPTQSIETFCKKWRSIVSNDWLDPRTWN
jgi:aryl-alcohol dehydrogenase-like predicted oxidoreductase